ncbi:G-protein coupled receptor moody isoform X1 [Cherax quadricarinatus]|uniref:G-protein coupled receptor moody isoform X1 n=2 Tax=Cherax quadricarinatus TaxID=27406 RepID=UPI00387E8592
MEAASSPPAVTSQAISSVTNTTNQPDITYSYHILGLTAACVFIIAIVGTIGNFLAVVSLLLSKKLRRSPSTAFMINLPACLLPVCTLGMTTYGIGCLQMQQDGSVNYPDWAVIHFFTLGLILSQVHLHTICALAFNRMLAVVYPVTYKRVMQRRRVIVYLLVLWAYSTLLWLPLIFGVFGKLEYDSKELLVSMKTKSRSKRAIHVFFTYVLPILFTSACYIIMYYKLRQSRVNRMQHCRRKSVSEAAEERALHQWDEQVTRTILVIFLVLLSCSVPHIVIHMLHLHDKLPAVWILLHVVFWLQFCIDPIIYMAMSQQYREATASCLRKVIPRIGMFTVSQAEARSEARSDLRTEPSDNAQANSEKDAKYFQRV